MFLVFWYFILFIVHYVALSAAKKEENNKLSIKYNKYIQTKAHYLLESIVVSRSQWIVHLQKTQRCGDAKAKTEKGNKQNTYQMQPLFHVFCLEHEDISIHSEGKPQWLVRYTTQTSESNNTLGFRSRTTPRAWFVSDKRHWAYRSAWSRLIDGNLRSTWPCLLQIT